MKSRDRYWICVVSVWAPIAFAFPLNYVVASIGSIISVFFTVMFTVEYDSVFGMDRINEIMGGGDEMP
jgi:hypothetical protein